MVPFGVGSSRSASCSAQDLAAFAFAIAIENALRIRSAIHDGLKKSSWSRQTPKFSHVSQLALPCAKHARHDDTFARFVASVEPVHVCYILMPVVCVVRNWILNFHSYRFCT